MKSKMLTLAAAAAVGAFAAQPAAAQESQALNATVIDLACYVNMGVMGPDHRECAQVCADAGIALGFLGSDGQIYLATAPGMAQSVTPTLRPHAEHEVTVTGVIHERGGVRSIVVDKIEMRGG